MVHNQAVELLLLLGLGIDDPFAARTSVRAAALVGFRPKFDQPIAVRIWRWEVVISRARAMHLPHVLQIDQAEIGELLCRLEDLGIGRLKLGTMAEQGPKQLALCGRARRASLSRQP